MLDSLEPALSPVSLILTHWVCRINSSHAQWPLCFHFLLAALGVDSLILRPVCMIDAGITSCSSSILCYKLIFLPGLLSTLRIVWVATISICLLLHLVKTLTPLLLSGIVFCTSSQLQRPKPPNKHHLTTSDPETIWPVTSFSIQRLDYMTPCPMVPTS